MNLPNGLTVARIAVTPLIAALPFHASASTRLAAFALFTVAALTDWVDGYLARTRKQETDLGKMLDPLADKLLLVGTFVPMYFLAHKIPFETPFREFKLAWWVVAVILGREVTMTWFRQYASRRGVVIAAIWSAKWKTGIQLLWQGSAYCWFWIATLAVERGWNSRGWHDFAQFNGMVAVSMMFLAIGLTVYSLYVYMKDYGYLLRTPAVVSAASTRRV